MLDKNLKDKEQNLQTVKSKLRDAQKVFTFYISKKKQLKNFNTNFFILIFLKALKEKSEMLRDTLDALQNLKMEKVFSFLWMYFYFLLSLIF